MKLRVAAATFAIVACATACGGSSLPPCHFGYPGPLGPLVFDLISPSPGATGVPDNLSSVTFQGIAPSDLVLAAGAQSIPLTLALAPTPTPTPEGALPQWIAGLTTQLSTGTTYTVKYNVTLSYSGCTSQSYVITVGSFTTQ